MTHGLKILFVFVDGLGIGADDPALNPLVSGDYPTLEKLLSQHAVSLDACLGVDGLPQSATGQASLLTGLNAPELMGRHIEGFPPKRLKEIIQRENLFSKLLDKKQTCTFANAYWLDDVAHISHRRESVTTVMTLAAFGKVRGKADLIDGRAVMHDVTRWTMHKRGYKGPLIEPEEAARHLMDVALDYNLTLFEYFLTDRAGHARDHKKKDLVLQNLERFAGELMMFTQSPDHLLVLSSDHGNIEDSTSHTHTKNPVPLVAVGERANQLQEGVTSLVDVTPAIVRLFD